MIKTMIDLVDYINEHLEDEDFFYNLQDILDKLEPSKEAVRSLLDAICSFDIRELYDTIFDNRFMGYVSESKASELKKEFKRLFEEYSELGK